MLTLQELQSPQQASGWKTTALEAWCCTCATLLSAVPRVTESEKPLPDDRTLECCARVICGDCIHKNYRFRFYCPYCQISSSTSPPSTSVLPQGLRDPPSYNAVTASPAASPPSYEQHRPTTIATPAPKAPSPPRTIDPEKAALEDAAASSRSPSPPAEDTLHFLNHEHDTVTSLSLRYGVPAAALRRANNLGSDHLLQGRRTVLIPGHYYKRGVSLSPRPIEGEEEEARKAKIRRWMVTCKVADYEVAVFYLEQAGYDFYDAVDAYFADEQWERENPLDENPHDSTAQLSRLARRRGFLGGVGKGSKLVSRGWFSRGS
ncbi:hypothetical protein B0H67DRAFT_277963 [Lasiosphaeris hirsuta]|uniref:LysM domain-containing protein n=1 Tax=Lasiosphaeris hirsuta TaxID=260670 RepID=A0AA40A8P9_9PEZI|nr:hypothetical protein B0H67DRAFT_277963 [Lasiosphaeris hirsuta]